MTSRTTRRSRRRAGRGPGSLALGLSACAAAGSLMLVGCSGGDGDEQARTAPPPPPTDIAPPPPPKRTVTPVAELMREHRIDERIVLAEADAPKTDEERIAVLTFFDSIARGDAPVLRPMLSVTDRIELDDMVETGDWTDATDDVQEILIFTGQSPLGPAAVGLILADDVFQPQMWYYEEGEPFLFEAAPTPPGMMDLLEGPDFVASWTAIWEGEQEMANRPDEDYEPPDVDEEEDEASSGGSPGLSPSGRGGGGRGRRTRPPGGPRPAPGAPRPGGR